MTTTKADVDQALQALGISSLGEFIALHGLGWMNLEDPMDHEVIENAVIREARYQEIFFDIG